VGRKARKNTKRGFVFSRVEIRHNDKVPVCKEKASPLRLRFGENLTGLRKGHKLTQEAMAEKIGTSTRFIQYLEAGKNFPDLEKLARLKGVFQCSWDRLFEGCEQEFNKAQK
jgi:DNA-binding XRE family transcriptional regulator